MSDGKEITRKEFLGSVGRGLIGAALGGLVAGAAGAANAAEQNQVAPPSPAPGSVSQPGPQPQEAPLPFRLVETGRLATGQTRLLGVAYDAQDRLYTAGAPGVKVFGPDGQLLRAIETGGLACCVSVAPDGFLYVGLRTGVEKYDEAGRRVAAWGERGDGPGQFRYVTGIAASERAVYLTDSGARKILRFAVNGDFIDEITECDVPAGNPACCAQDADAHDGKFLIPSAYFDCKVDAAGLLYVGHTGLHRIERYDENGKLLGHWGQFGPRCEDFCGCCNPTNLALFADGRVATTEKGVPRLKVYDQAGHLLAYLGPESFPGNAAGLALAVNTQNRLALADPLSREIRFYELRKT